MRKGAREDGVGWNVKVYTFARRLPTYLGGGGQQFALQLALAFLADPLRCVAHCPAPLRRARVGQGASAGGAG